VSDPKNKPALDEQTFGKLLEAAYVLQEHNREMRRIEESLELQSERLRQQEMETQFSYEKSLPRPAETRPDTDYTRTLAEIVEAQHQIQIRHLKADDAMALIAERSARIMGGSGAGIGILEGKTIRYHAGAGASALPADSDVPLETAICAICVRTGQVLRTPDVNTEFLFDPEICHPRGILSLVAVPIYHDGNIVGALEVYFDRPQGFVEQDVHTCRLMAGLVTEAIGRETESALKKSMAEERSSMMAAIEQLRPNLLPLTERDRTQPDVSIPPETLSSAGVETVPCWKCGNSLVPEEQFCGKCGAPRSEKEMPGFPTTLSPPWKNEEKVSGVSDKEMPSHPEPLAGVGARLSTVAHEMNLSTSVPGAALGESIETMAAASAQKADEDAIQTALSIASKHRDLDLENASALLAETKLQQDANWSSARKAREFLENLDDASRKNAIARLWRAHRGDFYLAVAIILVLVVIRWGMMPSAPLSATAGAPGPSSAARQQPPAEDNLSVFDKLLISLGLAEAPEQEATKYKGNPDTQVWIDLHTALYYCPGSELYGKTEKGRFASQRDAQLDQFEPALRQVCE
jgi:putative methionine-R-sulfoxide reductase with GAF domain